MFDMRSIESRFQGRLQPTSTVKPIRNRPRLVFREPVKWTADSDHRRLEILGDSKLVISWLNGQSKCLYRAYNARVQIMHKMVEELGEAHDFRPRLDSADRGRHVYGELNTDADALANQHRNGHMFTELSNSFACYR